ncbi:MAG: tail fiber domain-containing protein [Acidobacteriota bacterium]
MTRTTIDRASALRSSLTTALLLLACAGAAAAQDTLTVFNNNVGVRTDEPLSMFHISGTATDDLFGGMGPNPITGPAFNFGYSGASFGRSSGFINVRPDALATGPNPAFYFATGNIERLVIDNQGYLGVDLDSSFGNGFNPTHPIESQESGAHLTSGGVWTNASSRALKENIAELSGDAALAALLELRPVTFEYIAEPGDQRVGFIAEEVPELVANPERKTLASMDVVALLARVVQEQQKQIEALQQALAATQTEP